MSEMTFLGSVPSIVCWTLCVGSKSHCSHLIVPFYNHGVAHLSLGTGMFGELKFQRALLAFSIFLKADKAGGLHRRARVPHLSSDQHTVLNSEESLFLPLLDIKYTAQ